MRLDLPKAHTFGHLFARSTNVRPVLRQGELVDTLSNILLTIWCTPTTGSLIDRKLWLSSESYRVPRISATSHMICQFDFPFSLETYWSALVYAAFASLFKNNPIYFQGLMIMLQEICRPANTFSSVHHYLFDYCISCRLDRARVPWLVRLNSPYEIL